jgi:arsenate reductase (glutaredoxin)
MTPADITIYHNARCSNSRGALALLRERGIEPTVVDYLAQPLDAVQLTALVARLGVPVREVMRTYLDGMDDVRELLDGRLEDIESGRVKPITAKQLQEHLARRKQAFLQQRS